MLSTGDIVCARDKNVQYEVIERSPLTRMVRVRFYQSLSKDYSSQEASWIPKDWYSEELFSRVDSPKTAATEAPPADDKVNHPSHYTTHPSGIECIDVVEHMNFCLGAVVKYVWRAGLKDGAEDVTDLKKAAWFLNREIKRRTKAKTEDST